ncbi:XdhC family protein [Paenibacillus piri]|nr:XdhC/CoxI family protein [Paenibacillus piri]
MDFHELLGRWVMERTTRESALATIVKVQGHAYRKLGASMLLFNDGEKLGGISPGCLEADLAERVADTLVCGEAQYIEYDMRNTDDLGWGEAVGCGGAIHVLLEPVDERLQEVMSSVKRSLDDGNACLWRRQWDGDGHVSHKVELTENQALHAAAGAMSVEIYCEPRPRLILFGAGSDAEPLAALAAKAGFQVVVADWREALCCSGKFPDSCDFVIGSPVECMEKLQIGSADYVVIMSHQLERDRQCLELLWPLAPRYVGLLGSKTRAARILEGRMPPAWLHYPVGLPIGAEGPEEIAISAAAQLIAVKRRMLTPVERRNVRGQQGGRHLFGGGSKPAYGGFEAFDPARLRR